MSRAVQLVEVAPRDGFQSVGPFIPTARKIGILKALHRSGIRRAEVTSFVNISAVPQLADAAELLAAARALPDFDAQVLVPTARHAERALDAGARHLVFVLSVSERHNQSNVRRSPRESAKEYAQIAAMLPADARMRLNVATAFDCPYEGRVGEGATIALLETLVATSTSAEIALCDTTGRASPLLVRGLFTASARRFPQIRHWAFHAHDTYGMGAANVLAAWDVGIRIFDASAAGLGGCPFAPGATGNVATEDLVWMFDGMGIATGIELEALLAAAADIATLPGAQTGGRVRAALLADRL